MSAPPASPACRAIQPPSAPWSRRDHHAAVALAGGLRPVQRPATAGHREVSFEAAVGVGEVSRRRYPGSRPPPTPFGELRCADRHAAVAADHHSAHPIASASRQRQSITRVSGHRSAPTGASRSEMAGPCCCALSDGAAGGRDAGLPPSAGPAVARGSFSWIRPRKPLARCRSPRRWRLDQRLRHRNGSPRSGLAVAAAGQMPTRIVAASTLPARAAAQCSGRRELQQTPRLITRKHITHLLYLHGFSVPRRNRPGARRMTRLRTSTAPDLVHWWVSPQLPSPRECDGALMEGIAGLASSMAVIGVRWRLHATVRWLS